MITKSLIVGLCAVTAAATTTRWHELTREYSFDSYSAEFGKRYSAKEHAMREPIFLNRLAEILEHNADSSATWKAGVNHLTDRTESELKMMRGHKQGMRQALNLSGAAPSPDASGFKRPASVDWRKQGAVTAVKDQGQCGSCWSFAASETIESAAFLKHGELPVLSEQNILDCTPNPQECGGTGGCQGAIAQLAFAAMATKGQASEWQYPYTSYWGENAPSCGFTTKMKKSVNVTNHVTLPANKVGPLLDAVASKGPISISVAAAKWAIYESGVFDGCNQTDPGIDHAVQLVGYGTDEKLGDFYLVRNSWSPAWGELGYIRIKRTANEDTRCGMDTSPQSGFGCAGGPSEIKVCGTCGITSDSTYPILG